MRSLRDGGPELYVLLLTFHSPHPNMSFGISLQRLLSGCTKLVQPRSLTCSPYAKYRASFLLRSRQLRPAHSAGALMTREPSRIGTAISLYLLPALLSRRHNVVSAPLMARTFWTLSSGTAPPPEGKRSKIHVCPRLQREAKTSPYLWKLRLAMPFVIVSTS